MKVALVHDYLREYGGAERVLEALHELFPDAPVYVAFYDPQALGENAARFAGWDIRQTLMTRFPFYKKLYSPFRAFSAWCFEQLDLNEFDVIISSTNMYMAKAVRCRSDAKHLSYIHTPSRSLYGLSTRTDWKKNALIRVLGELINIWMRYVDFQTAQRPTVLLANSKTTQARITKYYRRDSVIVPPPVAFVDRDLKLEADSDRKYALFVSRLVFSKHPEIALKAAMKAGVPLKVAGTGPMLEELKSMAKGADVEFLGGVSDDQLADLYSRAKVLLYPAEDEDFGMVPVEAMAAGTPVLSHNSGEPRYTVVDGLSGEHVDSLNVDDWIQALKQLWSKKWDAQKIQRSVAQFSQKTFDQKIQQLISGK